VVLHGDGDALYPGCATRISPQNSFVQLCGRLVTRAGPGVCKGLCILPAGLGAALIQCGPRIVSWLL